MEFETLESDDAIPLDEALNTCNSIAAQIDDLALAAERAFEKAERESARDLIRDCFAALPDDLQELYGEVVTLHRQRRFEESNRKFDEWMARARALDLL